MKGKISFITISFLLLAILACSDLRKQNATRDSTPDFEISADQLAKEYKDEPSAADSKYGGRTLAITGQVDEKILGSSFVFAGHRQYGFATQCFFEKEDADSYKKVANGKEVTVLGVCKRKKDKHAPLVIAQCIVR